MTAQSNIDSAVLDHANRVAGGEFIRDYDLLELIKHLHRRQKFRLARNILEKRFPDSDSILTGAGTELSRKLLLKLSLATYKDPDLQPFDRLDQALNILKVLANLDLDSVECTHDQETLGLVGAIYKRKWELTTQMHHLETSLAYYQRGYEKGIGNDEAYTAINAAFILDLLASLEANSRSAETKREQARAIRSEIVSTLAADPNAAAANQRWWYLVTIAEAYFGLGRFQDARKWLERAGADNGAGEWEWESTTRQLARLLQLLHLTEAQRLEARAVMTEFLGAERSAGLDAILRGKVGLGLSGGGFRASLFHIGTLAKLAELDLLRHVEYLSCVSGGSIIGAHYYLEIRRLLQSKPDGEISRDDYIAAVRRVQETFLAGVQTNIRVGVLSDLKANAKMIFSRDYSRTNRLGELYEEQIFSRIDSEKGAAIAGAKIFINDLRVIPHGCDQDFSPKELNWRRANKVPILVLNATPLNTGHNWQFTTTWMGEPPSGVGSKVDTNYRLRRLYYDEAPEPFKKVRLGDAVAASSCVPGLFEPLPLTGLYPDKTVRLVDGGVHDNQGTAALLEQGCTVLLISDASGQMDAQDDPGKGPISVPLRAMSILQSRIREAQFHDLNARCGSGLLQGMMFIHLKEGLESDPVNWSGCVDKLADEHPQLLAFGIQREVQKALASMRTDLDSFTEVEAYALMTSAYRMTEHALNQSGNLRFPHMEASPEPWLFLAIEDELKGSGTNSLLMRQLAAADQLFLKPWLLNAQLKRLGRALIAAFLMLLALLALMAWDTPIQSLKWGQIFTAAFVVVLSGTFLKPVMKTLQYKKTAHELLVGLGMIFIGAFLAKLHLRFFDRIFLTQGTLQALKGQEHNLSRKD